jgi:hypothetical protein
MNIKKIIGWVIKLPLIFLVLATTILGFIAASGIISGFRIAYTYPIVMASAILLYVIGSFLTSSNTPKEEKDYLDSSNSDYEEEARRVLEEEN